jgi:hypothetical protein
MARMSLLLVGSMARKRKCCLQADDDQLGIASVLTEGRMMVVTMTVGEER